MKKLTQSEFELKVYNLVKEEYTVMDKYVNSKTDILMKHNKCGNEWSPRPNNFLQGDRCPVCAIIEKNKKLMKTTEDFKKEVFHLYNGEYEVLGEYKGAEIPILMRHIKCGYEWDTTHPNSFLHGTQCPKCYHENQSRIVKQARLKNSESFAEWIIQNLGKDALKLYWDFELNTISPYSISYGIKEEVWIKCIKSNSHGSSLISPTHFTNMGTRCKKCANEYTSTRFTGEKNHQWNPNKTDEERTHSRSGLHGESQLKWRTKIYIRDNYTCQCCGNRSGKSNPVKLKAHHLNGYHWDKENRWNVDNGITLCEDCHDRFHKIYGRKNNTKEQFERFIMENCFENYET